MMTWGRQFWPTFLSLALIVGVGAEIFALIANPYNSLSYWVWTQLKVTRTEVVWDWSATQFLLFGFWLIIWLWLTAHFFFHRFT